MLAREKWQIRTIKMLERVFQERCRQKEIHGDAMRDLPDGTGPEECWIRPIEFGRTAANIESMFRLDYEMSQSQGRLTKMHLIREEIAEAFEQHGDSPEFVEEILQVAALCVQWAEYKEEEREQREALL